MNEDEKKVTEEQPVQPGAGLSRKRRQALVMYLAVLFAVAFLLVAASLVIQNHKLKSSNESYSTALQKAESLQDENRELLEKATNTQQAYDLLLDATIAHSKRKTDEFVDAMTKIAEMTDYLSEDGLLQYNALVEKLPEQE